MTTAVSLIILAAMELFCLAALYGQAAMRGVTLRRHIGDAFRATLRGKRAPRPVLVPRPDRERIAELEREVGMDDEPRP
ncbi:MAG: hypothetical protein ACLGI5_20730 [Thermoleophilia bacterium]